MRKSDCFREVSEGVKDCSQKPVSEKFLRFPYTVVWYLSNSLLIKNLSWFTTMFIAATTPKFF